MHKMHGTVLIGVKNSNPNGDPDNGNMPRMNWTTGRGLMSPGSIKRKIRDWLMLSGHDCYIKSGEYLESVVAKYKGKPSDVVRAMCNDFIDVRVFGGLVPSTKDGKGGGDLRGPMQFGWAESVDPIEAQQVSITRVVQQKADTKKKKKVDADEETDDIGSELGTIGKAAFVTYGLYRVEWYLDPNLAERNGVTDDDFRLVMTAILQMFEVSRACNRTGVNVHGLYAWEHESKLGSAPVWDLERRIQVVKRVDNPSDFDDYRVTIRDTDLPSGITLHRYHESVVECQ